MLLKKLESIKDFKFLKFLMGKLKHKFIHRVFLHLIIAITLWLNKVKKTFFFSKIRLFLNI